MIYTTQKSLKELAKDYFVTDITDYSAEQIEALRAREGYFIEFIRSSGTYGVNGMVLLGHNSNKLYVITKRGSNVFRI